MISRVLNWIADKLIERAKRTPYVHLAGYMNRWWLVPYNRFGIAARVHQILRPDEDRHPHDHPWWYVTIILRGGYWEITPELGVQMSDGAWLATRRWRGPGSILFRRATSFHRLELRPSTVPANVRPYGRDFVSCWTLFITGPKRKDHDPEHSCWGFLVDGVKIPADVYLGDRYIATDYTKGGVR